MLHLTNKRIEFNHNMSVVFILLIFLTIAISQYIFTFKNISYGIVISLFLTMLIYITVSLVGMKADFVRSAESLALIPLYVLFTSSLPWFFLDQQYLLPAVYSLVLALCFWHIYEHDIDFQELGFIKKNALKYALMGVIFAIPTGIIEYLILKPLPAVPFFDTGYLLRDSLYMLVFVGLAEEILFRGIIFNDLKRLFNWKKALIAQGLIFGIMHMTWRSSPEILFTTGAGIILGFFYYKTKSIVGPISMHAINNVILVSIMPYLYPYIIKWLA
ncbi:MAG: CPBP family intramembrane metalloprotease [Candidatus Methanoperedens sp.]|nr:CPBP family intramembrane metalloprotease [Candidatus Methanoperedens sp.]